MANDLINSETYEFTAPAEATDAKATAAKFGTVKPSDSYSASGTAANGLVPSQKAVSDGLATKLTKSELTATADIKYSGVTFRFKKYGRVVVVTSWDALSLAGINQGTTTIGTLASGLRPMAETVIPIGSNISLVATALKMRITTSGVVTIEASTGLDYGMPILTNGCYIAAS